LVQDPGRAPRRRPPSRPAGTGEHLRPGLPHPAGTLALDQPHVDPAARRRSSRDAGQASALGNAPPRGRRARPPAAPSPPVSPDAGRRPPARGHRGHLDPCAQPGGPHTQPLQVQRDADRAAALPRTAEACPSGHRTPGHRTPGRWDVRSTVGRTSTAGPGARTGQRPAWPASGHPRAATTRWAANLARVTTPGGAWPPRTAPR
jgi:hypothetical protein